MTSGPLVLVLGDINVDALARLPAPLEPRADNLHTGYDLQLGGVGANVAVSLAKCGVAARLAGCVGRDWLGDFASRALARHGVDTSCVARADGVTGLVVIPIDPDGQRTILGARGVNELPPDRTTESWLSGAAAVHLVGYTLLSRHTQRLPSQIARAARERGIHVCFDPGPGPCKLARNTVLEVIAHSDTLLVGLNEAEMLTHANGAEAVGAIATIGAGAVIVKRGEGGSQFHEAGRWWAMPPFSVSPVDSTGAGDAFAAGYLFGKLRGWGMADCVLLANAMGAAAAARIGAGENMPGLEDVQALVKTVEIRETNGKLAARLARLLG